MTATTGRASTGPSTLTAYGVAIVALVAAVLLRWLLDPLMGDFLPLVTLFGAVAIAVWYGGYRPALLATALGFLACDYLFIQPRGSFVMDEVHDYVGLMLYLLTCSIIIAFGEAMRVSQRRLEEQRERLRTTLACIGDAVISTDTEGRITNMNAVAESLTGWKKEEAAGQQLDTVFRIVNEKTRQPVHNPATKAMEEGIIVGLANHSVLIAKGGTELPIDDSAAPIRCAKGEVGGCVLVFRDVTERRRVEQQLADDAARIESIMNHVIDGIIAIDENGTVEAMNPAAERLFGYRAEEVVGQNVKLLMPTRSPIPQMTAAASTSNIASRSIRSPFWAGFHLN